jgi:glycerol-3-phosphate dehydrogenase
VTGVYAGLRPLLAGGGETTARLSREHTVSRVAPGLLVVAGGKFTTYRVMAAEAVDEAASELGRPVPPSCTDRIPLTGASGFLALWNRRHELAAEHRIDIEHLEHLLNRYGDTVDQVLELVDGESALDQPLPGTADYLRAEAVYAVTHEGARHLDDVLTRRTRLSIEAWDRGTGAAPVVAQLIAPHLGWSESDVDREVRHYRARVAAELQSQDEPDDQTAEATQLRALEIALSA